MKKQAMLISKLICSKCDTPFYISRRKSMLRKNGHFKHIWCYKCKEVTKFIETGEFEKQRGY